MIRIGFRASEEKSIENVDGRTNGRRMGAYAISSYIHDHYASFQRIIYLIVLRPVTDQLHVTIKMCSSHHIVTEKLSFYVHFTYGVYKSEH